MKPPFCFLLLLLLFITGTATAATVDTIETTSAAMHKKIKAVVIKPASYTQGKQFPVVYLLHGYGDNYAGWITKAPVITTLADQLNIIIVCPDGGFSSWYYDSPVNEGYKYETYVAKELVETIDKQYNTVKSRLGRAITGLSMGGHGALYLAIKHQDVYGAAGSMSGGVDIRPFPLNWRIAEQLGKYTDKPDNWNKNTVINLTHLLVPKALALIVDCGTDDFFYKVNTALHENWLYNNIPHDFISRPGAHTWSYWNDAIPYQLLFMSRFFNLTTH